MNDRVCVAADVSKGGGRDCHEIETQGAGLGPNLSETRCEKASLRS